MEIHAIKSWYDQRHGVQVVEDDVLDVVKRIKQLSDGRVRIYYNEQGDEFDLVETCLDGTDRLVFSCATLDQRTVDRFVNADQWGADTPDRGMIKPEGSDFLDELDAYNEALEKAIRDGFRDRLGDVGERLARTMDIGVGINSSIHVKKDIRGGTD